MSVPLSTASRKKLYALEQTGEAIADEILRHVHECNEKVNKKLGRVNAAEPWWTKQQRAYYGALGRAASVGVTEPGVGDGSGPMRSIWRSSTRYREGTAVGFATEAWDARTQHRNIEANRWGRERSNYSSLSASESARLACRVVKPARAS